MSQNFIFFDVETSGINKYFGQIFQFAAILTDENFTVLDRFEIRSKRMSHIIPEPGALLVTGILPTQLENAKYTYYEFSSLIREKMLEWSPATFCGYNSLKFDEPFMRSMYYQNLYSPYLSQTNGNKRIDILPMVFAMEHLFPEALCFPLNEKGKTSKKLEHIAVSNGFENHNAHDAMGDVLATIHMAKLIKSRAPSLWNNCNYCSSRQDFKEFIKNKNWVLIHDNNNGWPITFPGVEISRVNDDRDSLFYDLRYSVKKIACNNLDENFSGRDRPFRMVRNSNMPIIFDRNEINSLNVSGLDLSLLDDLATQIKSDDTVKAAASQFQNAFSDYQESPYIEEQIYRDFESFNNNRSLMEKFHNSNPQEKITIARQFTDERFRAFARRIVFDNFQSYMCKTDIEEFKTRIIERINSKDDVPWNTVGSAIQKCDVLIEKSNFCKSDVGVIKKYYETLRNLDSPAAKSSKT